MSSCASAARAAPSMVTAAMTAIVASVAGAARNTG